jgi:Tfp pilus assembly protein PilV
VPRRHLDRDRGASLIEVVIACVLLGILSAAVLTITLQTQAVGVNNRNRVAASNLAAREIDLVREEFRRTSDAPLKLAAAGTVTNGRPLAGGTKGQPLVVDGVSYTVKTATQWNVTGTATSACDGGSLVTYPTLGVTVSVTWPNMGSTRAVVSTAAMAPTKGDGVVSTSASFVAVRVKDSAGAPSAGRGIAVSGGGSNVSGSTDSQGCAVVQVTPAASGTAYTATVTDTGYVDISGTANPSKAVGTLTVGKLNNSVVFTVARPGTVNLRLVDETGTPLPDSAAVGAQINLVASESSGATNAKTVTATGAVTPVTGLWPTVYGAYVGSTPPPAGYATQQLPSGSTITLDAVLVSARLRLSGLPATTAVVYALPSGTTTCSDPAARVVDPAAVALLPGTWGFYASGPTFECAPGPSAVALASGDNGEIVWGETTLRVDAAPAGVLWAVNRLKSGSAFTTCPGAPGAPIAVNIDAARSGPVVLPAGDWYVFVTDGAANGGCVGVPGGQYAKTLTYDADNVLVWASQPSAVTVNGVTTGSSFTVVAWTGTTTMLCTNGVPAGATELTKNRSTATTVAGTFAAGTWNFFLRDSSRKTCTYGGTVVVGGTGAPYTLPLSTTAPRTVQ